jgi:hypothetical protein
MKPVRTIGHTTSYTKPEGWDDERDGPCGVLSVRTEHTRLLKRHFSTWKPSAEELQRLVAGECVEICCVDVQPPLSVAVAPEAKDEIEPRTD